MKTGRMLVAILVFTMSCQTSKKDSQNAEPKAEEVECGQELVLECEDGKIDRCSIFKTGNHECIEKPDDVVFKCSEVLGFHCPEGEVSQ